VIEEITNNKARKLNKMRKFQRNIIPVKKCLKNSKKHFLKQCEIAYNCEKDGLEYIIEAEFENGKIADVFVLDTKDGIVYEVLVSETEAKCLNKTESYPARVIMVKL
jgi:hypothetical protein